MKILPKKLPKNSATTKYIPFHDTMALKRGSPAAGGSRLAHGTAAPPSAATTAPSAAMATAAIGFCEML